MTIRNKATRVLQSVNSMDPNVEPMVYPLFYPHGSQGWHKNIAKISNKTFVVDNDDPHGEQSNRRVTRGSYVIYRIGIRSDTFNAFLLGRRLFQQWIVDSYNKVTTQLSITTNSADIEPNEEKEFWQRITGMMIKVYKLLFLCIFFYFKDIDKGLVKNTCPKIYLIK